MAKKKKKNQQGESKALKTENDKISVGEIESSSIVFRLKIWPEKEFLKASQPSKLIKEALDSEYKMGIANKEGLRFTKVDFLSGNEFEVGVDIRDAGAIRNLSSKGQFSHMGKQFQIFLHESEMEGGVSSLSECNPPANECEDKINEETAVSENSTCQLTEGSIEPEKDNLKLLVLHSSEVDKEFLQLYFESPRYIGVKCEVADIECICSGAFLLTFTDSGVVPVLAEKQPNFKGKDAVVKVYDPKSAYDETAVMVSGLTEKIDAELLQLYFENERYGGGSIKNIDIQNSKAVIKFDTEKAAKGVLDHPGHKIREVMLDVEPYHIDIKSYIGELIRNDDSGLLETMQIRPTKCEVTEAASIISSSSEDKTTQKTHKKLMVKGLHEGLDQSYIELFFEDERKSGGGEIQSVEMVGNSAIIDFKDPAVVDRVLRKERVEIKGKLLDLSIIVPSDNPQKSITVTGNFTGKFGVDALEMFFENERLSGGGDIEEILQKDSDFIITFKEQDVADRVLKKGKHFYKGIEMCVSIFEKKDSFKVEDETETDETQRTVEIHGNIENIDKDLLMLFLENPARSGGGEIEKSDLAASPPLVTFRHIESADRILSRDDLLLEKIKLKARRYQQKQIKENELILGNVNLATTHDSVVCYLENISKLEVKEVVFSHDRKSVLAVFSNKIDWKVVKERHQKRNSLDGSKTEILEVPVCKTLLISNIADKTTLDGLQLTLEKPNLAGFDSVQEVAYEEGTGYAIVQFSDRAATEKVLQNRIVLDGAELKIDEFIPHFETDHTWNILNKAPEEMKIEVDPFVLDFILSTRKAELDSLLKSDVYKKRERFQEDNKEKIRIFACFTPDRKVSDPRSVFQQFYDGFVSVFVDYDPAVEDDKKVREMMKHPSGCVIERFAKGMRITGERESVERKRLEMENIIMERIEERKKREAVVENRFPLPPRRAELLSFTGYFDEIEKHSGVKVERSNNDLILSGEKASIKEIQHEIMCKIMFATDRTLQRSQGLCSNLSDQTRRANAIRKINSMNTKIVFSAHCQSKEIKFSAFTEDHLRTGIQIFDENYGDVHLQASSEQGNLLSNNKGSKFFANLKDSMNVTISFDELNIEINGELQMCNIAKEQIVKFLQENSFYTKTFGTSVGKSLAIFKLKSYEIKEIERAGKEESVKIKSNSNSSGILVSGLGNAVNAALEHLEELARHIFREDILLERPGVTKLLKGKHMQEAVRNIENEENVVIIEKLKDTTSSFTDEEVGKSISPSKPSTSTASNLICMFRTDQGLELNVFQDDITCHEVDAIVNPANNKLWLGGGVAGAILSAGGKEIQDECREYVRMHGEVDDGKAVVTNGGTLPCKKVIHAVGPRWPSGMRHIGERELQRIKDRCEEKLAEAMNEVLILCAKEELITVAVPAISSGVFGFPKDLCAKILVKTALQFSESNSLKAIREIHFVNNDHETVEVFRKEFDRMFGKSRNYTKAKPKPVASPATNSYSWKSRPTIPQARAKSNVREEENNSLNTSNRRTSSSEIAIEVVVGDLAQQQVDVIVNSASGDLNLLKNPCARGLSNVAGTKLQELCNEYVKRSGALAAWDFAVTNAGNLKCQFVHHAICGEYDGVADGPAENSLKTMVQNILKDAASRKAQSIAFPALGTGTLKFPRQKVAEILNMCVEEFGRESKSRGTLNEVKFVAYHADQLTIDAFNEVFKSRNATSSTPASSIKETQETRDTVKETRERRSAASNQPLDFFDEDNVGLQLGKVTLEIDQGDITREMADAIVVIGNEQLSFRGAVGNSIIEKEGPEFKEAARRMAKQKPGTTCLLKTSKMQAKYVAHVYPKSEDYEGLRKATKKMFEKCDEERISSVSIPAIGTGVIGKSAKESAKMILHALAEICCNDTLQHIRKVRIVIYEERMLVDFKQELICVIENPEKYLRVNKPGLLNWIKDQFNSLLFSSSNASQSAAKAAASVRAPNASKFEFTPLNLVIYSTNQRGIAKARGRLEQIVDENIKPIDQQIEQFKKLSDSQISRIRREAQKKDVMFSVDKNTGKVTLTGYLEDTTHMLGKCHQMAFEALQGESEKEKENNLKDYIQWFEVQRDGSRVSYDAKLNYNIEQHYKEKDESFEIEMINDDGKKCSYEINFDDLTVKNIENGEILKIERKELTRDIHSESSFALPSHWDSMPKLGNGLEKSYHYVELAINSQEFQDVKKIFESSSGGTIRNYHKIRRIQNPGLYQAYRAKKASMEKTSTHGSNEMSLFHGTDPNTCDQISHFGFNRSFAGRNATMYGEGVYFAKTSSYSTRYSGQADGQGYRHMLLAKVLVGQYTQGRSGMKIPPAGYDTVTDNTGSPSMFVAFNDNQCYPEYLLLFR